jgi:hypothetical protein
LPTNLRQEQATLSTKHTVSITEDSIRLPVWNGGRTIIWSVGTSILGDVGGAVGPYVAALASTALMVWLLFRYDRANFRTENIRLKAELDVLAADNERLSRNVENLSRALGRKSLFDEVSAETKHAMMADLSLWRLRGLSDGAASILGGLQ